MPLIKKSSLPDQPALTDSRIAEAAGRTFFETSPDAIVATDQRGGIISVNETATRLLGYSVEVFSALTMTNLEVPGPVTGQERHGDGSEDDYIRFETRLRKKDGGVLDVEITRHRATIDKVPVLYSVIRVSAERRQGEQARLRTITEAATDVMFRLDLNGQVIFVSPSVHQVLGFTAVETVGKHGRQFIHPDDLPKAANAWQQLLQGQPITNLEIRLQQKSRGALCAELTALPPAVNAGTTEIQGVIRDITVRRQAEEALRHSETRFQEITDLLPQPIYETDLKGTITFTNRAGFEHFGYTSDDLSRGVTVMDMIVQGERELAFENMKGILQGRPVHCNEYTAQRKDGTTFPIIITSAPIMKEGRPVGLRGAIVDITDRVRTEEHLRRSELKFRQLAETIHEVFWISDIATRELLYVSRAFEEVFGKTCQTFYEQAGSFLASVHPGDAARVRAAVEQQDRGIPLDEEFRIIRPDRSARWIRARTFFVVNEMNENSRIVGVAEDITDRKSAERVLRTHAGQLQALSSRLIEARESERRFIARELHDEIGQQLTGLKLSLDMMQFPPSGKEIEQLRGLQVLAGELLERVRNLSLDLRPSMLDDLGLLPALAWHFKRYREQTGINVTFGHGGLEKRFDAGIETVVYRVIQEALTNTARHAGVFEVTVSLNADNRAVHLVVSDAGRGFDPAEVLVGRQTVGLFGMRERVEAAGGDLQVTSAPGAGTSLIASIPIAPRDAKGEVLLNDDHRTC